MVGLGDEKGAVGLGRSYRLAPPLDLRRCECGEYLLLVTSHLRLVPTTDTR
jgi:hypothetical protein